MIFNTSNAQQINSNDVYLHDDLFVGLNFERESFKAAFICFNHKSGEYTVTFSDVIGLELTACEFWGAGSNIFDFEYIDPTERVLIPKLHEEYKKYTKPGWPLIDNENYIETLLTLSSGDQYRVACKTVQIERA